MNRPSRRGRRDTVRCHSPQEYKCPFPRLIHAHAGLHPGRQKVSELVVAGKVMGELFQPAEPVLRPNSSSRSRKEHRAGQGDPRFRDAAASTFRLISAKSHGLIAAPRPSISRRRPRRPGSLPRPGPIISRRSRYRDRKPFLYAGDSVPARRSGKGFVLEPRVDREQIDALVLEQPAEVPEPAVIRPGADPYLRGQGQRGMLPGFENDAPDGFGLLHQAEARAEPADRGGRTAMFRSMASA